MTVDATADLRLQIADHCRSFGRSSVDPVSQLPWASI